MTNSRGKGWPGTSLDVPLTLTFADFIGPSFIQAGWYGDGSSYVSDPFNKSNLVVQISHLELGDYDPVGALTFGVTAASGRQVLFDFSRPVVNPDAGWCPEACPDRSSEAPPDFAADPITSVGLSDAPQYSPPNYDFLTPAACDSGWQNGLCPNDFQLTIKTVSKNQYRLAFSPNIWRSLTDPDMTRGNGVMAVAYDEFSDSWTLSPLLERTIGGTLRQEPCPVLVERLNIVKGRITWVFLGCYDMPFEMKLTKR